MASEQDHTPAAGWESRLMFALRYVLPAVTVLGGLIVMAFGSEADLEGGAGIVSAGLAIYGMNWLYRASIEGDRVREREAAARVYFAAHGHWPDEAPRRPVRARANGADPTVASAQDTPADNRRPEAAAPAAPAAATTTAAAAATDVKAEAQPAAATDAKAEAQRHAPSGSARVAERSLRPHTSSASRRRPRGD